MKRGWSEIFILGIILILSVSLISAFSFGDFFKKVFGVEKVQLSPEEGLVAYYKFDGKNISVNQAGNYRVYVLFETTGQRFEKSSEFTVA